MSFKLSIGVVVSSAILTTMVLAAGQPTPTPPAAGPTPPSAGPTPSPAPPSVGQSPAPAQPQPNPGQQPSTQATPPKSNQPPPSGATLPKDSVPNAPGYPDTVAGRKLEEWIKDIDSLDPSVREHACRAVIQFGPSARRAIPALVKQVRLLNDLSPQASAIIALSEIVPQTPGGQADGYTAQAVDALKDALDSTQAIIRYRAAASLGWIGPPARAALPVLIKRIDDRQSWEIRNAVAIALGTIGRDENGWPYVNVLEALGRGAADRESKDVRLSALQSIINLGPPATGTPPHLRMALEKRLRDEKDNIVKIWVRVAIMRIDQATITDANLQTIAKQLKSTDLETRIQAAKALGFIGIFAKSTVPDLVDALRRNPEPALLVQLCWSLARMGMHAETALASLRTLQKSTQDEWVKSSIKSSIEEIEKAILESKKAPPPPVAGQAQQNPPSP